MEPDYFDILQEERMMGLNGFYDPSDETCDYYPSGFDDNEENEE